MLNSKKSVNQDRNQGGTEGTFPPCKIFRPPWKNVHVLSIGQNYWIWFKKFGPLSENSLPPLVSQAGYGPGVNTSEE